ncbi:hypothetical protein SK128_022065 [Halocaridina rubra]|uniref:Uncharacterized protein n=1 Tax=Halocaridina rubra TaxID=373956 RepID=A0AAN9AGQ6_HALRR
MQSKTKLWYDEIQCDIIHDYHFEYNCTLQPQNSKRYPLGTQGEGFIPNSHPFINMQKGGFWRSILSTPPPEHLKN